MALAGLNDLPDTIMTRAVIVRMRRRSADEPIAPWRRRLVEPEAKKLAGQLRDWAATADPLADAWPDMPDGIEDRDADTWEALLAVADLAGGHWPHTARVAAVTLVTESRKRPPSLGVLLLRDIRRVFDAQADDKLPTETLICGLLKDPESPWATIRKGEEIDARWLASQLRKYGIEPKTQRIGESVFKGYSRAQFEDPWKRYCASSS